MVFVIHIENTAETFRCGEDVNVLEAMEKSPCRGIPVGCRNGGCGACKVRVTAGSYLARKMNRAVLSAEEEARGCALACKLYPRGDISLQAMGRAWAGGKVHKSPSFSFEFFRTLNISQPDKET